jgi:hypothetical protein
VRPLVWKRQRVYYKDTLFARKEDLGGNVYFLKLILEDSDMNIGINKTKNCSL